jgi:hypothetical protein
LKDEKEISKEECASKRDALKTGLQQWNAQEELERATTVSPSSNPTDPTTTNTTVTPLIPTILPGPSDKGMRGFDIWHQVGRCIGFVDFNFDDPLSIVAVQLTSGFLKSVVIESNAAFAVLLHDLVPSGVTGSSR